MKKILCALLALAMIFTLAACGSGESAPAEDGFRVAMISDYSGITDQSFNQTTWEACLAFAEATGNEVKYYKPVSNDTAGRVASAELAIAEGHNVIVMPGYAFAGSVVELSGNYPNVKFVALDIAKGDLLEHGVSLKGETYDYNPDNWTLTDYVYMDNVYCAIYQEELAGFMAGSLPSSWVTPSWANWAVWQFPLLPVTATALSRALMQQLRSWASRQK